MRPAYVLLGAALVFGIALGIMNFVADDAPAEQPDVSGATATAAVAEAPAGPVALPRPSTQLDTHPIVRLTIASIEVDSPIVTLGIDGDGVMLSPDNPVDVAWYDFSGLPNDGTNVVLAGHVDFVNHGPAAFYRLQELKHGDEIALELADGTLARYVVSSSESYPADTAPVAAIVGNTPSEVVTLITCGGSFDPASQSYNKRLVVRGDRLHEVASN